MDLLTSKELHQNYTLKHLWLSCDHKKNVNQLAIFPTKSGKFCSIFCSKAANELQNTWNIDKTYQTNCSPSRIWQRWSPPAIILRNTSSFRNGFSHRSPWSLSKSSFTTELTSTPSHLPSEVVLMDTSTESFHVFLDQYFTSWLIGINLSIWTSYIDFNLILLLRCSDRNGRLLGVCASVDNCRLFVGGIPKTKKREEILSEMKKVTEGVVDVIVYPSAADKSKNRGFAFVEYESHRAAAMARRKLLPGRRQTLNMTLGLFWSKAICVLIQFVVRKSNPELTSAPTTNWLFSYWI